MAKLPRMQRLSFTEAVLTRLQQAVAKVLDRVSDVPFMDGKLLSGISILVGVNEINHGLGRIPQGWFVTRMGAAGYTELNEESRNSISIILSASATTTVDIWMF